MHREMQLLAVQADLWDKSMKQAHTPRFQAHAKHRIHSLVQKHAVKSRVARPLAAAWRRAAQQKQQQADIQVFLPSLLLCS